jgi:uncharacterized membrane protein YeiH
MNGKYSSASCGLEDYNRKERNIMKANQAATAQTSGATQIGILLLALVTAIVHLVILNIQLGKLDILFTLNGLGYLALLAAYFLPLPFARENRSLVRWAFMAFTAITVLAWVFIGLRTALGYITKIDELVLIWLLWSDRG